MGGHLYFVVHTHWDHEWYQPFQRMRARSDRPVPSECGPTAGQTRPETARFAIPAATVARRVNLAGRRVALRGVRRGREVELRLRPFEIVRFEVKLRS